MFQKKDKLKAMLVFNFKLNLTDVKLIDDFNHKDIVDLLKFFYEPDAKMANLTATFLNSIFSTNHKVFMISKSIFAKLINKDENHNYRSLGTNEYRTLLSILHSEEIIQCLHKPIGRKAGLYEIIDKDIVQMLHTKQSVEFFNKQKEELMKQYELYLNTEKFEVKQKKEETTWEDIKNSPEFLALKAMKRSKNHE